MGSHTETLRHGRFSTNPYAGEFFEQNGYTRTPQLVQWMVTLDCPLNCPHCLAAGDSAREELSLAEAENLIEQVAVLGVSEFLITGGEPLARPDLPEIIRILRSHRVRWSLNTACMPGQAAREAMAEWPPAFVAVSLDGPRRVHDRFRGRRGAFYEAMQAISYYVDITGGNVAAGTTVTAKNYGHLNETFSVVLGSGAGQWGLHLLVPEGRAAGRKDLFLSRRKLKGLLSFAASKRVHFNVTIADEIGYCGGWEPLVRDVPFFCGAGRAGCVVLPDGEVVPCTTLDTSCSAGNIRERSLAEIWEGGFEEMRKWSPPPKCAACEYVSACRGGCWLQRKNGIECFKDVWHMPALMKTALGAAICLGLGASAAGMSGVPTLFADTVPAVEKAQESTQARERREKEKEAELSEVIVEDEGEDPARQVIMQWYKAQAGGPGAPSEENVRKMAQEKLGSDPAGEYLLRFMDGERPESLKERAENIRECLRTKHHSLALAGLLWRDVAEWCLDGTHPSKRSGEECETLRALVRLLDRTMCDWRLEALKGKIAVFFDRVAAPKTFSLNKAGMPMTPRPPLPVLSKEHWVKIMEKISKSPEMMKALEDYLDACKSFAGMEVSFTVAGNSGLVIVSDGKFNAVKEDDALGLFEIIIVPEVSTPTLTIPLGKTAGADINVKLPKNTELTYADLLRLAYEQNGESLDKLAASDRVWEAEDFPKPLLLPALRAAERSLLKEIEKEQSALKERDDEKGRNRLEEKRRQLTEIRKRLAQIWLF